MIGEILELIGSVANGSLPGSRRELLLTITALSLVGEIVLVGTLLITWAESTQTLWELVLGEQWWKIGLTVNTVACSALIATSALLVVRERAWETSALARIGKRPRREDHDL